MDLKKRIKEIKEREREKDSEGIMESPLAQAVSTVLLVHEDTPEFIKRIHEMVISEVGREKVDEWFSKFEEEIKVEKNNLVSRIYLAAAAEFIIRIVEHGIIKEDHHIVYSNVSNFFKGLTEEK